MSNKTTPNKVKEFATANGMVFREFAGRCLLAGLSYDTVRDAWNKKRKERGFNHTTKVTIAVVLNKDVREVFGEEK